MTPPPQTQPASSPAIDAKAGGLAQLRAAAGPGYTREWGLFCDYTAATDQPTLPTTVEALTGFLAAVPARPATLARRVRAIAAAHRHAGLLLDRPEHGPAAPPPRPARQGPDPGSMIAACPTRGWPAGLWGRRDAFLTVLTEHLGLAHPTARGLRPDDLTLAASNNPGATVEATMTVAGRAVPVADDPRACAVCAVVRWLDILGIVDGLGRGSARMALTAAHAPTRTSTHQHSTDSPRWHAAAVLLPAIDQHGWHDDYQPLTTRRIRTRLDLAAERAGRAPATTTDDVASEPSPAPPEPVDRTRSDLDRVVTLLDDLADDADALNARIQALLEN